MKTDDLIHENEQLRSQNEKMRQILRGAAALADDVVGLKEMLRDISDLATSLLGGISLLDGIQRERPVHPFDGDDPDEDGTPTE